jgi:hypothetical protein
MADMTHEIDSRGRISITIRGELISGDADRFEILADQLTTVQAQEDGSDVTASFDSTGGDYLEGVKLGKVLWERGYGSLVKAGASCYSAAAFAFLGGAFHYAVGGSGPRREVEVHAKVGFHGFYVDSSEPGNKRFGVETGKHFSILLADFATTRQIDMKFILDSLQKGPDEFLELRTVDQFRRLDIAVYGAQGSTRLSEEGAVYAANYATEWRRPIAITPQAGESVAEIATLSAAEYRRLALDRVSWRFPTRTRSRPTGGARRSSMAGPIGKLFLEAAEANDAELSSLYNDTESFGIVPRMYLDDSQRVFHVSGFDYGGGFYATDCFVKASNDGTPRLSLTVVIANTIGYLRSVNYRPRGSVLFEVRSPNEVLW